MKKCKRIAFSVIMFLCALMVHPAVSLAAEAEAGEKCPQLQGCHHSPASTHPVA